MASSPDENGQLVYQAALYNNADLLAELLGGGEFGCIDFIDGQGRSALHIASANGNRACVDLLIKAGGMSMKIC
jgi:ankyrin repeat protein